MVYVLNSLSCTLQFKDVESSPLLLVVQLQRKAIQPLYAAMALRKLGISHVAIRAGEVRRSTVQTKVII